MELIHVDRDIVVCIKPPRVLSTDEPGGLPELVREALGDDRPLDYLVQNCEREFSENASELIYNVVMDHLKDK